MNTKIIIYVAIVLGIIHIFYEIFIEISELRKNAPKGRPCNKLKDEKCSVFIWDKLVYQKYSYCKRELCPGFSYTENDKVYKTISILFILEIIIKHMPAISTVVLLLLQLSK